MVVGQVTWGCSILQAQNVEIVVKALSPDLQLAVTVGWESGGAVNPSAYYTWPLQHDSFRVVKVLM